jgi:membrane protein required for colicin V production
MLEILKEFFVSTSPVDLAFFAILLFSVVQCYINGFVSSLISASKWVLSYVGTLFLFPILRPYIDDLSSNEYALDIMLSVVLFILLLFVIILVNKGISKAVKLSVLGKVDKIFGLFFGVLRTYIMFVFIFSAINSFFDYKYWPIDTEKSITFSFIQKGSNFLSNEIPDEDEYEDAKDKIQEL